MPQAETQSQKFLTAAISSRLTSILELFEDFKVALKHFQSGKSHRPEAGLSAVLRFVDEIQPSELDVLIDALKQLEAAQPTNQTSLQVKRINEAIASLEPVVRQKVSDVLREINRLEFHERSEYRDCFLRLRKEELAKAAPSVYAELKILDQCAANGRIAKLRLIRILPLYIRYLLVMASDDADESIELVAEMGRHSQYQLGLFGLQLSRAALDDFMRKVSALRRRNVQKFHTMSITEEAQQASKLEGEMAEVFSMLAPEHKKEAEHAIRMFETAATTVDEMVALSSLRQLSPALAAKAKRWRSLTQATVRMRVHGQQLEKVQRAVSLFGASCDPLDFASLFEEDQKDQLEDTTWDALEVIPASLAFANCMSATMALAS
ncbi:MAG TPA: hypothetical protein V6D17_19495 [Candidatus Obscuribacterales bacterium]